MKCHAACGSTCTGPEPKHCETDCQTDTTVTPNVDYFYLESDGTPFGCVKQCQGFEFADGTRYSGVGDSNVCHPCPAGCKACTYNSGVICSECKPDLFKSDPGVADAACVEHDQCGSGKFADASNFECTDCDNSCTECEFEATNCLSCANNLYWNPFSAGLSTCTATCDDEWVWANDSFDNDGTTIKACDICTVAGTDIVGTVCNDDGTVSQTCDSSIGNCKICASADNQSQCESCISGFRLVPDTKKCVSDCKAEGAYRNKPGTMD